ncbi:hypothetical protein [Mycobacterium sp.]|uniref:hypothetical protein n=1 Tax=Mycobacterium sp. TaxID=1785 RepID=UPI003F9432E7
MVAKLGDYLFGNVLTSVIAGATTFVWCILFDVPYAVLLGVIVAIADLSPTLPPSAGSSSPLSRWPFPSRSALPLSYSTSRSGWVRIIF